MVGALFDLVLINPLTNLFVLLTAASANAGIAVIILTLIIRGLTLPLTMRQMKTTRMMAAIAPRVQDINKRYKDPKRRQEETMKQYREAGVNPLGCLSGMLLQFPILIALYSVFRLAMGSSPEALVSLSGRLYGWDYLRNAIPLQEHFLWLNLGRPDPVLLPVTVGATTYVLQKISSLPPTDEKQAAQNSMMNVLMPLVFGWITLTLPSGLGLYYVLSNVIGMALQYFYVGRGPINWRALIGLSQEPVLPRALEARNSQMDAARRTTRTDEEPPDAGPGRKVKRPTGEPPQGTTERITSAPAGARRRRRYANGRRRGRR